MCVDYHSVLEHSHDHGLRVDSVHELQLQEWLAHGHFFEAVLNKAITNFQVIILINLFRFF